MPCVAPDPWGLVLPSCQAEGGTMDASPGRPLRHAWPTRGGCLASSWKPGSLGMKEIKGGKELRHFPPCNGTAKEPLEVIRAGVSVCQPGPRAAWCPPQHPCVATAVALGKTCPHSGSRALRTHCPPRNRPSLQPPQLGLLPACLTSPTAPSCCCSWHADMLMLQCPAQWVLDK